MLRSEIERFAQLLVEKARDAAIQSLDANLAPDARSSTARRWRKSGITQNVQAETLISDSVDAAIFFVLKAIDDGFISVKVPDPSGKEIDLTEAGLGELAGWYIGPDGWRQKYSSERLDKNETI